MSENQNAPLWESGAPVTFDDGGDRRPSSTPLPSAPASPDVPQLRSAALECALALAAEGIHVFPCAYASKSPERGSRGFYDATTNAAVIRRWFGGTLPRNLAVRTGLISRVWILDEDDASALAALEAVHGPLPLTRQSLTSRGRHFWWRTGGVPIPSNNDGRIGRGLDVKGEAGYVIAPPSVHPDGVVYEWANDAPFAEAPEWLVQRALRRPSANGGTARRGHQEVPPAAGGPYAMAALQREAAILAATAEPGRNAQLNRSSFSLHQLVAAGLLTEGDVERHLLGACAANGLLTDDGERQCLATIRSGRRAGLQHPRTRRPAEGRRA